MHKVSKAGGSRIAFNYNISKVNSEIYEGSGSQLERRGENSARYQADWVSVKAGEIFV